MTDTILLRVDRVERWRPPHADGGPILTTIEVHDVRAQSLRSSDRAQGPRLAFEHQGEGYIPTRLVLEFNEVAADYEPGDYLTLTIAQVDRPVREVERDDIPF